MATSNMQWLIGWQMTVYGAAKGAGPIGAVPGMQSNTNNQNGNGGYIAVPCTGAYPTQANFNTALSTVQTNMESAITNNLATLQGWNSGNP